MGNFVYSKITNDTIFNDYIPNAAGGLPTMGENVLIKGGANRVDKSLTTPQGVMTEVSDEEIKYLMTNDGFLKAIDDGFITVRQSEAKVAAVAADMTERDRSAPLRPTDYLDGQGHPGVTKAPSTTGDAAVEQQTKGLIAKLSGR